MTRLYGDGREMRYGSVCSVCGRSREADRLKRDKLRKHGKPDLCSACYSKLAQRIRNGRVSAVSRRKWNISTRYGLTPEQVDAMLHAQESACAICRAPLTKFHIDHSHVTGKVRGLLCHACNMKLPLVENTDLLVSALAYLERAER